MQQSDTRDLYKAFTVAYYDFCLSGPVTPNPDVLHALWLAFLIDACAGFPSLFQHGESQ